MRIYLLFILTLLCWHSAIASTQAADIRPQDNFSPPLFNQRFHFQARGIWLDTDLFSDKQSQGTQPNTLPPSIIYYQINQGGVGSSIVPFDNHSDHVVIPSSGYYDIELSAALMNLDNDYHEGYVTIYKYISSLPALCSQYFSLTGGGSMKGGNLTKQVNKTCENMFFKQGDILIMNISIVKSGSRDSNVAILAGYLGLNQKNQTH
jgi:hypothetical protein